MEEWNERERQAFEEENSGSRAHRQWAIIDRWWDALLRRVGIDKEERDERSTDGST